MEPDVVGNMLWHQKIDWKVFIIIDIWQLVGEKEKVLVFCVIRKCQDTSHILQTWPKTRDFLCIGDFTEHDRFGENCSKNLPLSK